MCIAGYCPHFSFKGVLVKFQVKLCLMSFKLFTFPYMQEIIKLAIHMTYFQNDSIYLQKAHPVCDPCIVWKNFKMRFLCSKNVQKEIS